MRLWSTAVASTEATYYAAACCGRLGNYLDHPLPSADVMEQTSAAPGLAFFAWLCLGGPTVHYAEKRMQRAVVLRGPGRVRWRRDAGSGKGGARGDGRWCRPPVRSLPAALAEKITQPPETVRCPSPSPR
jgi:hypothetical protein